MSLDEPGLQISLVLLTRLCELSSTIFVEYEYVRTPVCTAELRAFVKIARCIYESTKLSSKIHKHTAARKDIPVLAMRSDPGARAGSVRLHSVSLRFTRQNTSSQNQPRTPGPEITNTWPSTAGQLLATAHCLFACSTSLSAPPRALSNWYCH